MKKQWFHILLVVAEGPLHGAEIQRRVGDETSGRVTLYPVTLYRSLDELTARGLIEEVSAPEAARHNERRRYYGITSPGRHALADEAREFEAAARRAHAVLETGEAS